MILLICSVWIILGRNQIHTDQREEEGNGDSTYYIALVNTALLGK